MHLWFQLDWWLVWPPVVGVAECGLRWSVALGGAWLVGSRGRRSRWIGIRPPHNTVYIVGSRSSELLPFFPSLFSSSYWDSGGTQAFCRLFRLFPSTCSMFPVTQTGDRGEFFGSVIWPCGWIGAADRGRPQLETCPWPGTCPPARAPAAAPGSVQQH